jgi:hypothetical protein
MNNKSKNNAKFKVGEILRDSWWEEWGYGVVKKVMKTRIKIEFEGELKTYDSDHYQFLVRSQKFKQQIPHSQRKNN